MTSKNGKALLRRIVTDPPRSVALIGFGDSMDLMHTLPDDVEIWTLNAAEDYDFPRIDRLFEIHPLADIVLETPRFERLKKKQDYPIYMIDQWSGSPSSVRYPLDAVMDEVFENIFMGAEMDENAEYMDATLPYMIGLAVLEKFSYIYVYGFGLRSDTEYRYQRPGASLLIGWAAGKGAKIIMPRESELLPHALYGYEDHMSISRQNCEQWLQDMQLQENDWIGKVNSAHSKVITLVDQGASQEEMDAATDERKEAHQQMYMRAGAIHLLLDQIAIMDRKQEKLTGEMRDPFVEFGPVAAEDDAIVEPEIVSDGS